MTNQEDIKPEDVGVAIEEDHIEMVYDRSEDVHSLDMKIAKFREQEAMYQQNRDRPPLPQDEHCIYFMTGERGDGKSNAACALAHLFRTIYGYEVYCTGSLLMGRRISAIDSLTFMKSLPRKAVVFSDEAHTILDSYADAAYRNRAASDSVAMMRKRKIIFILASMKEHRVSSLIKEDVQWLVRPERIAPHDGVYRLPPFCYRINRVAGPRPWRGKTRLEQLGFPLPGQKLKVRTKTVAPSLLYESSKLLDTYDEPDLLAAMNLDANAIREHKAGAESGDPMYDVAVALSEAWNAGWRPQGKSVRWTRLAKLAEDNGCQLSRKVIYRVFDDNLEMMSGGRIRVTELQEEFFE